jgi:peptidoglycan/LPS O-acetylase OafA/YrhL
MYIASTVLSAVGIYPCNLLDGTYWFITFIIIQYLFFWIAFKFGKSAVRKKVILIILTLCGYIIFKKYFIWVNDNDVYAFAFLLGVVYSDFIQKAKMPSKKVYIYILMVLCVMVYLITLQWFDNSIDRFINGISLAIVEIMVAKILKTYMSIKLPILSFAGRISYELYLTEGIFFNNKILYDVVGYNYAGLILHICVIVVLSIAIQKLSYVITRCIGGGGHA